MLPVMTSMQSQVWLSPTCQWHRDFSLLEELCHSLTQLPLREDFSPIHAKLYVPGLSKAIKAGPNEGISSIQAAVILRWPVLNSHWAHFLAQLTLAQVPAAGACLGRRAEPRSRWSQQWLFWSCDICFPPTLKAWEGTALIRKPAGWSMHCWWQVAVLPN